ncbi:hypothetical protein C3K47_11920 [Solitalea longa]|uniref:Phosphoribosyltransferase domain-containing protein n=1 Tax=Solitalea longa TaxID=2079460 RepID=A0A2S5A2W1_9SPHI|nr:uracil phosphoribosyltransferase [Solitalea longa]POY36443.1 hypothetical protein C3K47_11920 [Solitalea longa]
MDSIKISTNNYGSALLTTIRNCNTPKDELRQSLIKIGNLIGSEIVSEEFTYMDKINTPLQKDFLGFSFKKSNVVIVSTKDDYNFFLKGIAQCIKNPITGYMDFSGERGKATYTSPVRSLVLPETPRGQAIDAVIIAKSVLATGCTAVTLAKSAYQKLMPNKLIITTCFYSLSGIEELKNEIPNCKLYLIGNPDELDQDGMLVPGVGNLDQRLQD